MKSLLKYSFLAVLFLVVACGSAATENEKTVATAKPTTKPVEVERPKPVLVDNKTADVAEATIEKTTEIEAPKKEVEKVVEKIAEKKTAMVKEKVETPALEKEVSTAKVEAPKPVETTKTEVEKAPVPTTPEVVKETVKATTPEVKAPSPAPKKEVVKPTPPAFSHTAWNTLAQKHISAAGKVNYKGFKADIAAFDAYLKSLADNPVQSSWTREEKMAYWINAYNAFTIKLIVDNYPVKSIMDLEGGKPWDKKWIKLGGKTYSLNNIEHDILRPTYKDARIHFAVNCAAKSCPPVWNQAWTAKNLNGQLARSAKQFINNTKYNKVGGSEASISKIFEWYAVDFGDIITYLNKYATTKVAAGTTVTYQDYNWALNE